MKKLGLVVLALFCLSALTVSAAEKEKNRLRATLTGIAEANGPSTVITDGTGTFTATINDDATITYTLTYKNLSTPIQQAHIHIGATKLNVESRYSSVPTWPHRQVHPPAPTMPLTPEP